MSLIDQLVGTRARPSDLPLDLCGDLGLLSDIPLLRLDATLARLVALERRRLKPRDLRPW